jgi:predicted amidophosphoribosyltransferase
MLLPAVCPVCSSVGSAPCRRCWAELEPAPRGPVPMGLDACLAVLAYVGAGREVVARLKYRNARAVVAWLSTAMAALVTDVPGVVTWAPTTSARRQERGFDHAEVLARAVARRLGGGIPVVPLLERATGPPQTGRSGEERRRGPTYRARASPARHVLLVDDVVTTGATLRSAALALRHAAGENMTITGLVAARTPLRRSGGSRWALRTPTPYAV